MNIQHTPGFWGIEFCTHQGASTSKLYVCSPSDRIAEVYIPNYYRDIDRACANARLMAAAPELLEVAYLLLEMANAPNPMGQVEIKHQAIALAKIAIIKAQGG